MIQMIMMICIYECVGLSVCHKNHEFHPSQLVLSHLCFEPYKDLRGFSGHLPQVHIGPQMVDNFTNKILSIS